MNAIQTYEEIGAELGPSRRREERSLRIELRQGRRVPAAALSERSAGPEQMTDALLLVQIFDKQMRIATDAGALGESPYGDIAGYGLLGVGMQEKRTGGCGSASVVKDGSQVPSGSAESAAPGPITTNAAAPSVTPSAPPSTPPQDSSSNAKDAPAVERSSAAVEADLRREVAEQTKLRNDRAVSAAIARAGNGFAALQ